MIETTAFAIPALLSAACLFWSDGWSKGQTPAGQVVCHGDSLTFGENAAKRQGTASGVAYPGVLASRLGAGWKVTSLGRPGWTIGQLAEEAALHVDTLYNSKLPENVLIVFGGANDLGGARMSASRALENMEEYCRARKAAHPWKILVATPPMAVDPSVCPPDFNDQMLEYGELIRGGWRRFADGIVDVQADPRLGAPGCERDSRYFNPQDLTHLTDAGYEIIGDEAAKAVARISGHAPVAK
ncbi:hypothetical protein CCAX7_13580 [Capsulimonas corticalis]|uniref:Uncharacterized protein n=1 Tax=Capsulimonas corticalis TaxID=2219043 RepID=A0A402D4P9_9BACT|nr:SGNH/GDSL hydrolase family protein [Capsulimonas corticalis]BDI29307.1 hypothetical protein CCAX7_13580 [Capsulimonas corticalis]